MDILITGLDKEIRSNFHLVSQGSGLTTATYQTDIFTFPKPAAFDLFKVYFEPLVSGDSITLKYDLNRADSFGSTIDAAITFSADGAINFKLLNSEFEAEEITFQIVVSGSSAFPIVNRMIALADQQELL